jgi:hypothetical protein
MLPPSREPTPADDSDDQEDDQQLSSLPPAQTSDRIVRQRPSDLATSERLAAYPVKDPRLLTNTLQDPSGCSLQIARWGSDPAPYHRNYDTSEIFRMTVHGLLIETGLEPIMIRRAESLPPIDRLPSEKYRCISQSELRNAVGYPYVSGSAPSVITPSQRTPDLTSSKTATKYLGPDYHSFLSSDSESGLMGLLGILNGISAKHEEDRRSLRLRIQTLPRCDTLAKLREFFLEHEKVLNTVYCCLLDFHEQDLPRESCGILQNEYRNFQQQLETFHIRIQKLHINHDAKISDGLLACRSHELDLDTLNQHHLSTYQRRASWNFFDMRERAVQEKRLEKLHLGLLELHKQVARRDSQVFFPLTAF